MKQLDEAVFNDKSDGNRQQPDSQGYYGTLPHPDASLFEHPDKSSFIQPNRRAHGET
ncbi:hypothetical protein D3C85_1765240 [compost metagenome]